MAVIDALLKITGVCSAEGIQLPEGLAQAIYDLAADNGGAESALERLPAILAVAYPTPVLKAALDEAVKALSAPQTVKVAPATPDTPAAPAEPSV